MYQCLTLSLQPGFVFLDFSDRNHAEEAYQELKKINFGLHFKPIQVEYAKPNPHRTDKAEPIKPPVSEGTPIAPLQGVQYPSNPQLCYVYPDPSPDIITNISYAIGSVPRLYTQVLHLMNKMNMPPPFLPVDKDAIPHVSNKRNHDELVASDESEIEDDQADSLTSKEQEEMVKKARINRIIAEKQKLALKKSQPVKQPKKKADDHLTAQQRAIKDQCKPLSELSGISVFKNYKAGVPSKKLYIKNLSRKVKTEDLQSVYSAFSKDPQIDLKKKGRMRDQAFVTFPDQSTATLALECTNGYLLMDRPMAVQYGLVE
ncbi:hypothetical protein BDB01DRAFT_836582 [Pilobolus umbonatus]|nr:hypothetical protein BDB01DRAFT_836582 [Pilobolus umbonatus]